MSRRTRRIIVAFLTLGFLGVGSAGVYYVMKKGKVRQDPLVRGLRAEKAGQLAEAERLYRSLLESKPDHPQAFGLLVNVLQSQGKLDEMEAAAETRCESAPQSADGWDVLVRVAMMRGRFTDAERIARTRAVDQPLLLQWTLWRINDLSADPRRRLAAAAAALQYAELADGPEARAQAELFAARAYLDISGLVSKELAANLRQRSEELVSRSEARLKQSLQLQKSLWVDTLLARANLLSATPSVRSAAAEKLRLFLAAHGEDSQASPVKLELIDYRLRAGAKLPARADAEDPAQSREAYFEHAKALAQPMADLPAFHLLRILRWFDRSGAHAEALELLAGRSESQADPILDVYRCRLLLQTAPEKKAEVAERALKLIGTAPDWRIAVAAHDVAKQAGEPARALEAMMAYQQAHPNQQLALGLASIMAASGEGASGVSDLIEQVSSEESSPQFLGPILEILDRAGPDQVFAFLERRIRSGVEGELRLRLSRSMYVMRRMASAKEEGIAPERIQALIELARSDLARCTEIEDASRPEVWLTAARMALAAKSPELAGTCVARMIRSMEGGLHRSYSIFRAVAATKDEKARDGFLAALAAGIEGSDDAEWVAVLSGSVARGKSEPADVLALLLSDAPVAKANARTLEFTAMLAAGIARAEVAEEAARRLIELDASDAVGALVLGGRLFAQGKYDEVLATHAAGGGEPEQLSGAAHRQCVFALIRLDRFEDAEQRARAYFAANPRKPDSYNALVQALLAAGKKREALGVLASGIQNNATMTRRAQLLIELDEPEAAEELLLALVRRSPTLLRAWSTLVELFRKENRSEQLIAPLTSALELVRKAGNEAAYNGLVVLRAMVREHSGQLTKAIDDYESSIQAGAQGILPLNNVAWLICQADPPPDPKRLAAAKRYVQMALELQPDNPNINDTAAHVYLRMGDHPKALEHIDRAIEVRSDYPKYRLTRARVLAAKGDKAAAIAEVDRVLAANPARDLESESKRLRETIQASEDD